MSAVVQPLFLQVALSIAVLTGLAAFRIVPTFTDRDLAARARTGRKDVFSKRANLFADNLQNQFELPVLFYVAVLLALQTGPVPDSFVTLSWVFAISRVVHALIHVTVNIVPLRLLVFGIGLGALIGLWLQLFSRLGGA